MIALLKGELADKYGYSDINLKQYIPADKNLENIHTFILSAEKWFVVQIKDMEDENKLNKELNKQLEKYLRKEKYEVSRTNRKM